MHLRLRIMPFNFPQIRSAEQDLGRCEIEESPAADHARQSEDAQEEAGIWVIQGEIMFMLA